MKIICSRKHTVGTADKMLYGHFLEHFHRQIYSGVFDPSSPFAVAAVNKDPQTAQTVELQLLDDTPREMRIHTLNGPSPDAYNDVGQTQVGVTVGAWTPFDGTFTLPAHSVNVIELR